MQPQHVPAWKRLGLKLKYARDLDERISSPARRDTGGHGVASETTGDSPNATKKRRIDSATANVNSAAKDPSVLSPSLKRISNCGLKKKVSFTAETKQLDGDSSKSLISAWEAANLFPEELLFAQSQVNENVESPKPNQEENDAKVEKEKKMAKKDRQKSETQGSSISTTRKSIDALDYLKQFHLDRPAWKFSKNREIWILKHILSIDDIPVSYDPALAEYVRGLKSTAAISRLTAQCLETISDDIGKPPLRAEAAGQIGAEVDKKQMADSLGEQDDRVEQSEYRKRMLRTTRAHLLLEHMPKPDNRGAVSQNTNGHIHPDRATPENGVTVNMQPDTITNGPRKKKSKLRNNAVIESSESSSDDSSNTSDEELSSPKSRYSISSTASATINTDDTTSSSDSESTSDDASSSDSEKSSDN